MLPETRYARSGDAHIAYQVVGSGPLDLVYVPGFVSHLEYGWENPLRARQLQRLAAHHRLILFDKRGTGLSDRVAAMPTLEQRMDDVRAVMDAAGSERAAILGVSEGGPLAFLFAATHPARAAALLPYGTFAKYAWSPDYPWAPTQEEQARTDAVIEQSWGGPVNLAVLAPSVADDPAFRDWWAAYTRRGASPGAALALSRMNRQIDVRPILPAIRVPTLVLHRTHDLYVTIENGRYLAAHIPGATLAELPGTDHLDFVGDGDALVERIHAFLADLPAATPDRVLATVLCGRIANADALAAALGTAQWRVIQDAARDVVRRELERHRGRLDDLGATGYLADFDGPARAVRCASAIGAALRPLGLDARTSVHTGECERLETTVRGPAAEVATALVELAGQGEVLVSQAVTNLVPGAGFTFLDRGRHTLPGEAGPGICSPRSCRRTSRRTPSKGARRRCRSASPRARRRCCGSWRGASPTRRLARGCSCRRARWSSTCARSSTSWAWRTAPPPRGLLSSTASPRRHHDRPHLSCQPARRPRARAGGAP
jgi:pimeloyl-ACP methyl ester carboxylesterase